VICAAVPVLRKKNSEPAQFQLRGGTLIAVFGVLICAGLLTQIEYNKTLILLAAVAVAFFNWLAVRKTKLTVS
jgi:hypothetical protein